MATERQHSTAERARQSATGEAMPARAGRRGPGSTPGRHTRWRRTWPWCWRTCSGTERLGPAGCRRWSDPCRGWWEVLVGVLGSWHEGALQGYSCPREQCTIITLVSHAFPMTRPPTSPAPCFVDMVGTVVRKDTNTKRTFQNEHGWHHSQLPQDPPMAFLEPTFVSEATKRQKQPNPGHVRHRFPS